MKTRDKNQEMWGADQRKLVARFFDLLFEADKQAQAKADSKEKPVPPQPING